MLTLLIRMTRIMLYICLGALSKTIEEKVVVLLPMSEHTRKVFLILQYLVLFAFCLDVVKLLFGSDESTSLVRRQTRKRGPAKRSRGLLSQANPRRVFERVKLSLREFGRLL
jgi:hypothetical protein